MKLTDEQIQEIRNELRGLTVRGSAIWMRRCRDLVEDRQAWKEEAERYAGVIKILERDAIDANEKLNQAVEVIERVHKYAKENSNDSKYLEQVQAELEHFLSQEGGSHEA